GAQRLLAQPLDDQILLEALELPAEGVPAAAVVRQAEMVAVADDHPGAAAEDRHPGVVMGADRIVQAVPLHPPGDRGPLPARDHEAVEPLQRLTPANLDDVGPQPLQHQPMGLEVALDGEYADFQLQTGCSSASPAEHPRI